MSLEKYFKGKSVLVTGAGQGVGRALSQRLYGYGATVYALTRTKETLDSLAKECPNIIPIHLDVGKSWEETRKVIDGMKTLDVVINNAAIADFRKPFLETTEEDYDHMFNVNLKAVTNISQIAAKNMIAAKQKGTIINISSIAALRGMEDLSLYCTSKAALDMLTKCMALELGPHSIRVNSMNLGPIKTSLFDKAVAAAGGIENIRKTMETFFAKLPYGNDFMPMDDVVNTILFAASDLACTLTGSCIVLDAGYTTA